MGTKKKTRQKSAPDIGAFAVGVLNIWWHDEERSLYADGGIPRPDQSYTFNVLTEQRWYPPRLLGPNKGRSGLDPSFIDELERRGYDITTFRLAVIRREHPWVKPGEIIVHKRAGVRRRVHHVRWRGPGTISALVRIGDVDDPERYEEMNLHDAEREYMPATLETQMAFVGEGI